MKKILLIILLSALVFSAVSVFYAGTALLAQEATQPAPAAETQPTPAATPQIPADETQAPAAHPKKAAVEENALIRDACAVFKEVNYIKESGIPRGLVYSAQAIAIFPKTQSGGFIIGGTDGKGVIINRISDKWSAPAFLKISGKSFGLQAGMQEIDIVLVIMDKGDVSGIMNSHLKLGINAGLAIGTAGRDANLGTDIQFRGVIYSYSRARGAYIGLKLEGSNITPDVAANTALYGEELTTADIIMADKIKPTPSGQELIDAVVEYTRQ